ncbi:unnamed protein product [Rangifer tarandus platyrhynchus]|uniref:Uncharacterized protein n=2 Tax=Rangifer tarandus platyrhynchus TaxID=3082113 RepID=A0ACB0FAB0_RANTA|nr:unnamed protein product [Rangifer tarandus platyrhynchus]CAI9709982.1 unnamed protein product [Rangifer tarandus platyrhynchus]
MGKTEEAADFRKKAKTSVLDVFGLRYLLEIQGPYQVEKQPRAGAKLRFTVSAQVKKRKFGNRIKQREVVRSPKFPLPWMKSQCISHPFKPSDQYKGD